MIETNGERESAKFVRALRLDDDGGDIYIYINQTVSHG